MTAHYTTETAVEAIRKGAADYLQKPVKIALLRNRIADLLASAQQRQKARSGTEDSPEGAFEGIIATSGRMWDLFAMIQRIAPHYRSVLIQGPTGAGKDLVAEALHRRSKVSGKFVVLNCSAVVETLFESELFGHVKGAFTGADREKIGLLELAHGGTLFLDEIGDMPLSTQAKLLRALQNREILPVGSHLVRKVEVRVVAATHRNLRAAIAEKTFREDLFYRLSMVELTIPALAERLEAHPRARASFCVQKFSSDFNKKIDGISPRALAVLQGHEWPGNVRELEHAIGRACMLSEKSVLDVADLPEEIVRQSAEPEPTAPSTSPLADQERRLVEEALREAAGNQSQAARKLGIGRDALRYKMKRHKISG